MANMTELLDRSAAAPDAPPPNHDATTPTRDTPRGDTATGDGGRAPAPSEVTLTPTIHSVSERDAALLLDMKEPVVASPATGAQSEPEEEPPTHRQRPHEQRSILNAASDHSDGEDAAAVAASDGTKGDESGTKPSDDDDDDEDVLPPVHGEKGVEYTLSELFVNPNLKLKSANIVLKKDPFAIPRATDNVTEYRPRFNPLSILMSEEKLLPHNFTFDFSEGIPGEPKQPGKGKTLGKRGKDLQGRTSRSNSDFDASSLLVRKSAPSAIRNPQVFGDKLATMGLLMGSMPRQPQLSPKPLINTPTVHNPFGEPLLELVVNNDPPPSSDPVALQRLRSVPMPPAPVPHQYPDQFVQTSVVSTQPPAVLQDTLTAEFDAFGVDLHNISNLSKLSIAANNVAAADTSVPFHASATSHGYATAPPPLTPSALYGGLANYLPAHFAEKRVPQMVMDPSLYDIAPYHAEQLAHGDTNYNHPQQQQQYYQPGHNPFDDSYATAATTSTSAPPPSDYDLHAPADASQPMSKKSRSKNVFRPCTHPGCTKGARGKSGLCQKHGGGKRCATANCPKGAQGSSKYCLFHGGGYRCTAPGCTTGARGTSGLCAKHGGYKRAREGGVGGSDEFMEGADDEFGDGGPAEKKPRMEAYEGHALEATG